MHVIRCMKELQKHYEMELCRLTVRRIASVVLIIEHASVSSVFIVAQEVFLRIDL